MSLPIVRSSSQSSSYQDVMQVGLAQGVESKLEISEFAFVDCMSQIHHAWKGLRPSMIELMDGVA